MIIWFGVRRSFLATGLSLLFGTSVRSAWAQQQPEFDPDELRELLEVGLKARRPQEFRFIARVVALVVNNTLSLELVHGTFQWARKKPRYRVQYFERALRVRAARQGIQI